jgi:hypothetical protein
MAAPYTIRHYNHELRVWGLKIAAVVGLECEACHTHFSVDVLQELAETRAIKNIGTPDVYCCTWPPRLPVVRGASNIGSLLIRCGIGMPSGAPPAQPAAPSPAPTEPKAVCRWCKGAGELTFNFKTKPCDCVEQENIRIASAILGRDWTVKKKFRTGA